MAFKIYTKTGDLGKTSLIGGTKVPKSNIRIEAYGTVDELNSFIGLTADQLTNEPSKIILKEIQDRLFTIGSSLACDPDKESKLKIPDLKESDITLLENEIDKMYTSKEDLTIKKLDFNPSLISIDKFDINDLNMKILVTKGNRLSQIKALKKLLDSASALIELIKKEYHLK